MADDKAWPGPERRTNLRLRRLIDDLQAGVKDNREAIAALTTRVVNLETDVRDVQEAPQAS